MPKVESRWVTRDANGNEFVCVWEKLEKPEYKHGVHYGLGRCWQHFEIFRDETGITIRPGEAILVEFTTTAQVVEPEAVRKCG